MTRRKTKLERQANACVALEVSRAGDQWRVWHGCEAYSMTFHIAFYTTREEAMVAMEAYRLTLPTKGKGVKK